MLINSKGMFKHFITDSMYLSMIGGIISGTGQKEPFVFRKIALRFGTERTK